MSLTIIYTAQLAEAAGARAEEIDLPAGTTLAAAVTALTGRHGGRFRDLLLDDTGKLRSTVLAVIDGAQATGDRESLALDGAKELLLMTPIAGG